MSRRRSRRGRGGPGPGGTGQRPPTPPAPEEEKPEDPRAKQLSLWCLNKTSGEVVWKRSLGGGNHQERKQNMSSPSPVTDGNHVWVMTGTGILKAFDFQGNEKWSRNIPADYGDFGLNWGYASSPLLHENKLYVQVLHGMKTDDPSYVLGINKETGETLWKVERPTDAVMESPDSYTTPALLQYDGKTEIVITGGDYVTGHDPKTGEELWRAGGLNPEKRRNYRIVASPVVEGDLIIVPTRQNPLQAFSGRRAGRYHGVSSAVVFSRWARRTHSGDRWALLVRPGGPRSHAQLRAEDRKDRVGSGASAARDLFRFSSDGGRKDLCDQRRRGDYGYRSRSRVQDSGRE